jgi:AraC-like DNA-binding protein
MPRLKAQIRRRPLRGQALDAALNRELEVMITEGRELAPISLAAVARRLGLGSRTTFYEPARRECIRAAANRQAGLSQQANHKKKPVGQSPHSAKELAQLRKQLNDLRAYVAQIAINAHRIGLQPESLLTAARRQADENCALDADQLVMQYLSNIGLLAKLDPNVRGLRR